MLFEQADIDYLIHTYIYTYIYIYIHTYIHTYMCATTDESTAPSLQRAEWIKYLALFFNKEAEASTIYGLVLV